MYYVKKQISDLTKDAAREAVSGLISAVVPVYSLRRQTLPDALRAIDAQTYRNIEIIVASNGVDGAAALVQACDLRLPCRIVEIGRNLGASLARNTGALASRGEYLWFVDSDIVAIDPGCAAHAFEVLRAHPEIGALGGILLVDGESSRFTVGRLTFPGFNAEDRKRELIDDDYVNTACVFVPRAVFFKIQGFTECIEYLHDDNDFGFKIIAAGYRCVGNYMCAGRHPVRSGSPSFFYEFMAQKNTLLYLLANYTRRSFVELLRKKKAAPDFIPAAATRCLRERLMDSLTVNCGRLAGSVFVACHPIAVMELRRERQRLLTDLRRNPSKAVAQGRTDGSHDD